ncbi:MAG: RagB/SusD family nutrient uptake outer membrane protein [Bacteroidota bacterium]|nr:RagB/SusD family nutrient uptake outer membrane protein [Bacteroidota bacterium]
MKLLRNILLIIIVCLSASCSDFLDKQPDDQLTLDMVFNDKNRTEEWLAGVYMNIQDPYWSNTRWAAFDPLSDDMAPSTGWEQFGWGVIAMQRGDWSPSTTWDANWYTELPKRIRSAYIFINHVKANPAQLLTEEDVQNMKYEARFMIAYYYSLLLEVYGPIPFHTDLTPADAPEEELLLGQTPYDEIVDWIDKELKDLSTKLPASYTDSKKYGRATSVMCLAVRARMLLFAASPLVNGNTDYKGFVNNKGVALFNTTYDANKWIKAKDACKELIDLAEANGHQLYYEYNDDGTIDPFLSYQNMMFKQEKDGNKEILFARPYCDYQSNYDYHSTPRGCAGNGGLGVTQSLVDAFFMDNGLQITDPNSGYSEKGFSTDPEVRKTKWSEVQTPGQVTLSGTYNMYCHREPRFYISVLYNGCWFKHENRVTHFYFGDWDGGPTHDAPSSGYLVRKKHHPDFDPRNGVNPYRPGILYRLGEAYLNYAEALNETDPGNSDILKYVNKIRERGGIPGLQSGLSQEELRQAIRRERRVELNNEGLRYFDIRRWKIGEQTLNANFWGMNFSGTEKSDDISNPKAYFTRQVYQVRKFEPKNYWFPIPQSEIDKNPNLVQNPFWK